MLPLIGLLEATTAVVLAQTSGAPELGTWSVVQQLTQGSIVASLLAIAVWYFKKDSESKQLALDTERNARLDLLMAHIHECDNERRELRDKVSENATRIAAVERKA